MELIKYPNPILFKKSTPVEITNELKRFIDEMFALMRAKLTWGEPVGLAAPQVGRNIRVFIALEEVYINPELTPVVEAGITIHKEGCYSLEDDRFDYRVPRFNEIDLKWQDRKGKWHEQRFKGFQAEVIQHEYDHLEGRLCSGKMK